MSNEERPDKLFREFIATKKILIADPSAVARTMIAKSLNVMGARTQDIVLVPNFSLAEQEVERVRPEIVICDYDLGKKCGLDLLQKQRLHHPETKDSLFILVTGNTSQSAVAKAAEEDVDTFILKPFTAEVLRNSILKAAIAKIRPSEYMEAIEAGKLQLAEGDFDGAMATFEKAKEMSPTPSLACFYLGQTHLMKQALENAHGDYLQGLEYNKIHYKCLVGLYEVLMAQQRFADAYEIVKRISHYFPANPQRLTAVLRLAIMTQSYEDVERYYRIFINIDERNDEIIKYVCAALVVCGKYYLQKDHPARALELFQKAAITASRRTKILREIITTLIDHGMVKQADEFLKKYPAETHMSADYHASDLLVMNALEASSMVIEQGRELVEKGIHDPLIYEILIKRSLEAGLVHSAEDLVRAACEKWPKSKNDFIELMQSTPARNTDKSTKSVAKAGSK